MLRSLQKLQWFFADRNVDMKWNMRENEQERAVVTQLLKTVMQYQRFLWTQLLHYSIIKARL